MGPNWCGRTSPGDDDLGLGVIDPKLFLLEGRVEYTQGPQWQCPPVEWVGLAEHWAAQSACDVDSLGFCEVSRFLPTFWLPVSSCDAFFH